MTNSKLVLTLLVAFAMSFGVLAHDKDGKDHKDMKDAKSAKEVKDAKSAKEVKDAKSAKEAPAKK